MQQLFTKLFENFAIRDFRAIVIMKKRIAQLYLHFRSEWLGIPGFLETWKDNSVVQPRSVVQRRIPQSGGQEMVSRLRLE